MVQLAPFKIERWMDAHETTCTHNLAESCCDSLSLQQVQDLVDEAAQDGDSKQTGAHAGDLLAPIKKARLTYGQIRGSKDLRKNIAATYQNAAISADDVLVTQGAIGANFLVLSSLVSKDDHVVCVHPTYQQLLEVPAGLGAKVDLWRLQAAEGWKHNLERLEALLRPTTKLLVLNNPNNPTGSVMDRSTLSSVVEMVRAKAPDCLILSDEVYRPLFHSTQTPPSILDMGYRNVIATGSLSKAWSLAGIRLGWIATPRQDLIEHFAGWRDYNTICVSMLDDAVAAAVLQPKVMNLLLKRNTDLAKTNLRLLSDWMQEHPDFTWTKPLAGTTAFIQLPDKLSDDVAFCERLYREQGVLLGPGSCFDWPGFVRIGYVCDTQTLREGLDKATCMLAGCN